MDLQSVWCGCFSRSLGWLAGGFLLWRQAAAKAAHAPQFGTGLWSQRNLCLPCVCRVVSPAFGVSKSTFVMPTHFQLRARSTRVVAARWVFCQAEPALQGSTPGGPAKARLDPPGRAARAVPAPPTHPTPTGHPGVYMDTCTSMVLRYDGLSESSSSSLFRGQQRHYFFGG